VLERETGIEPATNGLGSRYSTIELLPPLAVSLSHSKLSIKNGFAVRADAPSGAIRGCSAPVTRGVATKAGVILSLQGEGSLYLH
jgi:hypothetical protein